MKKILWTVLVFLVGCNQTAKDFYNAEKWNVGDELHYSVEITETELLGDSITKGEKTKYNVELIVSEIGDTNVITWTIKQSIRKPDSLLTNLQKVIFDTTEEREEIKIVYQTNKTGQYLGILNWADVEKYVDSQWNSIIKSNEEGYRKNEKNIIKLRTAFSTRQIIEAKLARDIMALHSIYGQPYSEIEIQSQENMTGFNNQSISSNVKIEIMKKFNDHLYLRLTSQPDSTQTANQINDFVNQFVTDTTPLKIKIMDTCIVNFNKLTCWASQITYWRSASMGAKKNFL